MRFDLLAHLAVLSLVAIPTLATPTPFPIGTTSDTASGTPVTSDGATPNLTFDTLWHLTNRFWTAFMYPNNVKETLSVNSTMFSKNVLGRVDVSRTFDGRELNTEYIFGLFSALQLNPNYFSLLGIPTSYNITHFSANQNVVACSVVVDFEFKLFGTMTPVEIDVWFTFNSNKAITQYDATFRWLDWQFNTLLALGAEVLGANSTAAVVSEVTGLLAKSVCETAALYCNGTNQQYSSNAQCYNTLTQEVRFGSSYELGMNTLLCRMVHQNMVPFRPDVHCSHIGPSGGAYCVDDLTYSGVVTQPYFTNTPFVPYGYQNSDKMIAAE